MRSFLSIVLLVLVVLVGRARAEHENYPPGVTAAYLLRLRGFITDEFSLVTKSGYVLTVTRGRNPLFEQRPLRDKEPILFIHGVLSCANNYLLNSFDIRPKDLTGLNFSSMSVAQLKVALADEPSAKSLPFLALNRGHVVWLLSRRGTPGSQQLLGDPLSIRATPTDHSIRPAGNSTLSYLGGSLLRLLLARRRTMKESAFGMDNKFWDYSLDQQSVDDFPLTIQFVLNNSATETGRLALVGHSAGASLTLIGLSQMKPEMRRKVSVAVLWAPSYATSNKNVFFNTILRPLVSATSLVPGPLMIPPVFDDLHVSSMMAACRLPPSWRTYCENFYDQFFGFSGGKQPMRPQFVAIYSPTSGHELAQQGQQLWRPPNHTMHKFDYGRLRNMVEYGQPKPPAYNLSTIDNSTRLSFYVSSHDKLVTVADVQKTREQLKVPSRLTQINETFNHIGYFFHDNTQNLSVIPSMYDLETLARRA